MPSALTLYRAPFLPGRDSGNIIAETQMLNNNGVAINLLLPSNGTFANKSFRVRCGGRVQTSSNTTFELRIYFGTLAAIGSNTLIFDAGAQTINNVTSSFEIWLDMQWTADGNLITGRGTGQIANFVAGPAALNNTPLAADPNRDAKTNLQSQPPYGFTVTGIFGASSPGNHAYIDDFSIDTV
jgi:hypothetical protein